MTSAAPSAPVRLPFELADLRLLSLTQAKAILKRFEFLADFLMHAPTAASLEEKQLLLQSIELLQEIAQS